ncbi:MLO-like protein 11 isoform X4 [Fagus crenata]
MAREGLPITIRQVLQTRLHLARSFVFMLRLNIRSMSSRDSGVDLVEAIVFPSNELADSFTLKGALFIDLLWNARNHKVHKDGAVEGRLGTSQFEFGVRVWFERPSQGPNSLAYAEEFLKLFLLVGTKLQHVIATLALENACINEFFSGAKLRPRDDLFWFKNPELLLSLIHFVLFQNAFELASFFWFWLEMEDGDENMPCCTKQEVPLPKWVLQIEKVLVTVESEVGETQQNMIFPWCASMIWSYAFTSQNRFGLYNGIEAEL